MHTLQTDCRHLYDDGYKEDGVYIINPDNIEEFDVYCELSSHRTVIQRHVDETVDFYS